MIPIKRKIHTVIYTVIASKMSFLRTFNVFQSLKV